MNSRAGVRPGGGGLAGSGEIRRPARFFLCALAAAALLGGGRCVAEASIYVVTSTADTDDATCGAGDCTLREAIDAANAHPGMDQIVFLIRPLDDAVKTIQPLKPLPLLSDPAGVLVDALSQPGSAASTRTDGTSDAVLRIELDGSRLEGGGDGLVIGGGPSRVQGFVINRFPGSGVQLAAGSGHELVDNFIGTDASGKVAQGNADDGVDVLVPGCRVGRNLISGNGRDGVELAGESAGTSLEGNLVGLAADGTPSLGNRRAGIAVFTPNNRIGGLSSSSGNYVGGNFDVGVVCVTSDAHDNVIQSDVIFQNASHGVMITLDAGRNLVARSGGFPQPSNSILDNGGNGVCVTASAGSPNSVLPFRVERNELIGIDYTGGEEDAYGVTKNDPLDADTGPNGLQNSPELLAAVDDGTGTWVYANFSGDPGEDLVISFYADTFCHPSGHGDGRLVAGGYVAQTDAKGEAHGRALVDARAGEFVSALAIDGDGNSSEFSNCIEVAAGPTPTETAAPPPTDTPIAPTAEPTATETPTPEATVTATAASDTPAPTSTETVASTPTPTARRGDANCDGAVTAADLVDAERQMGAGRVRCGADVDGDAVVNGDDVDAVLALMFAS